MSNVFGPKKPLFGPYTYRVKQNTNGDTLLAVYHGSKRIAHMDAYWAYSVRTFEDREADVQRYGKGLSCYTDLRTLGAEGKYPNILSVSHAFIDDPAYMNKGIGRAMYEAMMAEGYAVRETRIGGSPGPLFFVPDVCKGVGSTSADALRVWASLGRDYPSAGVVIRVDAPPVVGSRAKPNPRRQRRNPRVVYHGTSTEYLEGFAEGVTDDLLYLTTSKANAWEYAQEKADEVGGEPIVLQFDLDVLAQNGTLAPDWKWLPRRMAFRNVSWEEGLDETGHVTFEGTFASALLRP